MAILTLNEAKSRIGVSGSTEDARLTYLLSSAEAWVQNYCKRRFASEETTEFYSGDGTRALVLRRRPVSEVSEVRLDNGGYFGDASASFGSDTILVPGEDYALSREGTESEGKAGILVRVRQVWPIYDRVNLLGKLTATLGAAFGNIRVTYTAGETPEDVKEAVAQLMAHWRLSTPGGGLLLSEKLGDWSYQRKPWDTKHGIPAGVFGLLSFHKEKPF